MLLTLTARRCQALPEPDHLGFLLHKHPQRVQSFDVYGGTAHVFYPRVNDEACTAALLLEVDPVALVRGRSGRDDAFALGHYVNDRPYVASSLLSVALAKVFRSALNGLCPGREELVDSPLDLTVSLPVVPGRAELVRRLFAPMGWDVSTCPIPFDDTRPEWGDAPVTGLTLTGSQRLADALNHLYVLLPVLDETKHYWVGDAEVDKLMRAGAGWLPDHPDKDLIAHRYLAGQRDLRDAALTRLADLDDRPADLGPEDPTPERRRPLVRIRHEAVMDVVRQLRPTSIADLGCGSGALLGALLSVPGVSHVIGTEVSDAALTRAARRLHVDRMTERQADRLSLLLSSLMYEDERLADLDLVVLMEVIEHIDPERLPTVERNVFETMRPHHVVVTTPNSDYNVRFPAMEPGELRHTDHRFEWSREEFGRWTRTVAGRYGYDVETRPVGETDPRVGPPTQMAVFTLTGSPQVSA